MRNAFLADLCVVHQRSTSTESKPLRHTVTAFIPHSHYYVSPTTLNTFLFANRNPTQVVNATATNGGQSTTNSTARSSCPCVRSKSMEDVRTEVVSSNTTTDWPTYIKDNFKNLNNGHEVPQSASTAVSTMMSTATKHSNTRRSMDNLLKVDTNFGGRPFQVCLCVRVGGLGRSGCWFFINFYKYIFFKTLFLIYILCSKDYNNYKLLLDY